MQVQVVVMSANMGCSHCRQRVANVVSKMNGEHPHSSKMSCVLMSVNSHNTWTIPTNYLSLGRIMSCP